jgi:hypothetical protein
MESDVIGGDAARCHPVDGGAIGRHAWPPPFFVGVAAMSMALRIASAREHRMEVRIVQSDDSP